VVVVAVAAAAAAWAVVPWAGLKGAALGSTRSQAQMVGGEGARAVAARAAAVAAAAVKEGDTCQPSGILAAF